MYVFALYNASARAAAAAAAMSSNCGLGWLRHVQPTNLRESLMPGAYEKKPLLLLLLLVRAKKPLELYRCSSSIRRIKNYSGVIRMLLSLSLSSLAYSLARLLRIPSTYRLCNYGVKIYAACELWSTAKKRRAWEPCVYLLLLLTQEVRNGKNKKKVQRPFRLPTKFLPMASSSPSSYFQWLQKIQALFLIVWELFLRALCLCVCLFVVFEAIVFFKMFDFFDNLQSEILILSFLLE